DVVARHAVSPGELRRPLDRQVVGLGRARGENDLARVGADQPGNVAPRRLDRRQRIPAVDVALAVRVAEMLGEIGQHRLEHARVERGRGLVVEIDRQGVGALRRRGDRYSTHAARASTRLRNAVQASRKRAMSASLVLQPRLTRIVQPAISGGSPIACSTWLGPTLPEEQAAPALTITPARSSAITWVSAAMPGSAIAEVFGRRGAAAPTTTAASPCSATAPNPAMPARFSLPARRPRSCPPPRNSGASSMPSAMARAPTPIGPPSLCADKVTRSAPSPASGNLPAACTASQ